MTTDSLVSRLRELERAATPGPWHYEDERYSARCVIGVKPIDDRWVAHAQPAFNGEVNGKLIAAVRNALPLLLDVVEAARCVAADRKLCLGMTDCNEGGHARGVAEDILSKAIRAADESEGAK